MLRRLFRPLNSQYNNAMKKNVGAYFMVIDRICSDGSRSLFISIVYKSIRLAKLRSEVNRDAHFLWKYTVIDLP